MGLLTNLRNAITGGAATVRLAAPAGARRGDTIAVKVDATARASGRVNAVYVLVRATETAELRESDVAGGRTATATVHGRRITYETRIAIAGALELHDGQSYAWEGQVTLPATAGPSFRGHMVAHTWELEAGLDMTGNDPDSGWQTIEVA